MAETRQRSQATTGRKFARGGRLVHNLVRARRPRRIRKRESDRRREQWEAREATRKPRLQFEWADAISGEHWDIYRRAMQVLREAGIPFLLGGGFALAVYTGRWRNTKDIDFYISKDDRDAAVKALTTAGFADYYAQLPYDRNWIYRSTQSGVIVDLIWAMANQRAQVDSHWFEYARSATIRGESLRVVPMAEFVWCKLYILQRDHCDWTDVLNLLYAASDQVDWRRLLRRLEEDWPLLKALLTVFGWLCPRRAIALPAALRNCLGLDKPGLPKRSRRNRVRLLDSRGWFSALLPKNKPLEI